MARVSTSSSIGRTPPAVTVDGGSIATTTLLTDGSTDAVAVPVAPARAGDDALRPLQGTAEAAARYGVDLAEIGERARLTGAAGDIYVLQLPRPVGSSVTLPWSGLPPRLVLVGVGSGRPADLRRAGAALARSTRGLRRVVTTLGAEAAQDDSTAATAARAVAEGYLLAAYVPPTAATSDSPARGAAELVLLGRDGMRPTAAVAEGHTAAAATWLVRDLATTPASTKTPAWLADQAKRLATKAGLEVTVRSPRELAAEGFGGILAVGAGSASSPRLVTVSYTPDERRRQARRRRRQGDHVRHGRHLDQAARGHGPDEDRHDRCRRGAGHGARCRRRGRRPPGHGRAAPRREPRRRCLLPPRRRPDDVGRDHRRDRQHRRRGPAGPRRRAGLGGRHPGPGRAHRRRHAHRRRDPGPRQAARRALLRGRRAGAALVAAGDASGELAWHMPLVEEYEEAVHSDVADLRHVPVDKHIGGGSITAALFLRHFVGARTWAHLDIAGPARSTSDKHEVTEGATGFGARLLLRYLDDLR